MINDKAIFQEILFCHYFSNSKKYLQAIGKFRLIKLYLYGAWVGKIPWKRETHSSFLAWRIPWTEEPGGQQSMRSQSGGHDWATKLPPPSVVVIRRCFCTSDVKTVWKAGRLYLLLFNLYNPESHIENLYVDTVRTVAHCFYFIVFVLLTKTSIKYLVVLQFPQNHKSWQLTATYIFFLIKQ